MYIIPIYSVITAASSKIFTDYMRAIVSIPYKVCNVVDKCIPHKH